VLRLIRWTLYSSFVAFMGFVAICVLVGVVANLNERHPELNLPGNAPESLSSLSSLQLQDCLEALHRMRVEQQEHIQEAFTGEKDRDSYLREYQTWSKDWRKRFEKLGITCGLTEVRYDGHPTLGTMAEIYRRLEQFQKGDTRLVKRYVTENQGILSETRLLFERARALIDELVHQQVNP
jgi:hypothetical protein